MLDYSEPIYKQDLKMCNAIFKNFFSKFKLDKEDLIQVGLYGIIRGRKYYIENISKLSSYLYSCCYLEMYKYVKKNYCKGQFSCMFLNEKIVDDITIEDTMGDEMHIDELGLDKILLEIKSLAKKRLQSKSNKYLLYIDYKVNGLNNKEIQDKLVCCKQFISKLYKQFKQDLINVCAKHDIDLISMLNLSEYKGEKQNV